jgi:hypothetical protein
MTEQSPKKAIKTSASVCQFCDQNLPCGVLKTALEILDQESQTAQDTYNRELFNNFRRKLEGLGYGYPHSQEVCWLHDKRTIVQDLAKDAKRLIDEVRSRQSA